MRGDTHMNQTDDSTARPTITAQDQYPSNIYAWYVAGVLMIANIVSFVDRQIISLLIEPIKADLQISDTQISILHGFAFAIFYAVMGIPLGRLADTRNRRNIAAIGIAAWSLMTAFCGLAKNFSMFFVARVGVGVGEATLTPSAYSIVSDCFPKGKRSKPISLLAMGPYIAAGMSFMIGGWVVQTVSNGTMLKLPYLGALAPWQTTFIVVGLPGLLVSLLVWLTVKEPSRKDTIVDKESDEILPISDTFIFIKKNLGVYSTLTFGYSVTAMLGYGLLAWMPTVLIRNFGWEAADTGFALGAVVFVFGGGGTFLGGVWADWLIKRGNSDAYLRTSVYACVGLVAFVAAPLMTNVAAMFVLFGVTIGFLGAHIGVGMAAVSQVTPNEYRGQVLAIYLFFLAIIGAGVGPFLPAFFTDYIFRNSLHVHYSLSLFGVLFVPVAFLIFYSGLRKFGEMIENVGH